MMSLLEMVMMTLMIIKLWDVSSGIITSDAGDYIGDVRSVVRGGIRGCLCGSIRVYVPRGLRGDVRGVCCPWSAKVITMILMTVLFPTGDSTSNKIKQR